MKILITGSSGFLGKRAARHFSNLGYEVLTPAHHQLDITDSDAVNQWFREHRPQVVLHCAAVSDTGVCQREPERTARINVQGSVNLARACGRFGAKFVFCSSDQVYAGSPLPGPHRETEPLNPGNVYAQQKRQAEQLCSALCPHMVSLRLSWMYAAEMLPGEHGHLLTSLCAAIKDETLPLTWPVFDHRGITDAEEVVRNLPAAMKLSPGIYNFGAENDMDTYHTIRTVFEDLGLETALQRLTPNLQAFADASRDIRMDVSLARSQGISFASTRKGLTMALKTLL